MDFYQIATREISKKDSTKILEIYPDFQVGRSKDLMVRGKSFYAIWDNEKGMWSTDEYDVQRLVDEDLRQYRDIKSEKYDGKIILKTMGNFSSKMWSNYRQYINQMYDNANQLDDNLTFNNTNIKKTDYISRVLPYKLEEGPITAYDELMSVLYLPEERAKLEWAIGSIISGDSKDIQKFIVLYGEAGSGKSTVLNIIQKLFEGYYTTFEAKALVGNNNSFSMEVFKSNPLVAIQHDGDLSKIEDNTKLNSIISHEYMTMNEKYKSSYMTRSNAFLFMGTNKPVKITDAKSGIIRRLIDVSPSGERIPNKHYNILMSKIDFELGAIAYHCLGVYRSMGKNYYSNYRPMNMLFQTDVFFNFVEDKYLEFKINDGTTGKQAYTMYKAYCDEMLIDFKLPYYKFREELKNYFENFKETDRIEGQQLRSYYSGFKYKLFENSNKELIQDDKPISLILDKHISLLDGILSRCKAQYANEHETPIKKWSEVTTTLSDIDTKQLHYVKPPPQHIVIDFDLKDADGNKSMELNLEAASKWPFTYAEFSKGGSGIHLHYMYDGDVTKLSRIYSEGIEIKPLIGNESLRRRLTKCNNISIATINSGLPLKEEKVINFEGVKSEKQLRASIEKNLRKEIHPGTKPSIDFIHKILEDAYNSDLHYDLTDMRPKILAFANNSSNQADYCVKLVSKMKFKSEEISLPSANNSSDDYVFFDVEVFKNLFIVCYKMVGSSPVKMINPSGADIEELLKFKLIGFNCRRYDNHILYARYIGYNNEQLYELSQKIINNSKNAMFGEAYNISYTDVYDFASNANMMSLKKWEIKLGIHHQELGIPWDQPVPENMWDEAADYCCNDVIATEAVFNAISGDWAARQILAALSGLSVNDTTNNHTIKIVFGNEKDTKSHLVYTDLSQMFPGYTFDHGVSTYRGIITGEGGYVYAEPGMYSNVAVLDIASMHPTSIETLTLFGEYTKRYSDLKLGRIAIKHDDMETLKTLLDGKLIPFIEDAMSDHPKFTMKEVSNGLKTALNSGYGLTSAKFDNAFKDPRNKDNIVAKRGALFMVDLQYAVQEQGFTVAHIKTDSIKIPNATPEIIQFVMDFGKKYGYEFEHETTYEKMCLVNDAVYIATEGGPPIFKDGKYIGPWTATGTQFAQPYVFKTLFSKEQIVFEDMCETKSVTSALYLDMNEDLELPFENGLETEEIDRHRYHFVGKVGLFCPIKSGCGGGLLLREKDGKYYAATGSKGYRWFESEMVKEFHKENDIDISYYTKLVDEAVEDIRKYGDFEWFVSDSTEPVKDEPPWECPSGKGNCKDCKRCVGVCIHDSTFKN